jgi:hypothetical protein
MNGYDLQNRLTRVHKGNVERGRPCERFQFNSSSFRERSRVFKGLLRKVKLDMLA